MMQEQLEAIEKSLDETLEMSRFLLAIRLVEAGHAENLTKAMKLVRDTDRLRELFPLEDD